MTEAEEGDIFLLLRSSHHLLSRKISWAAVTVTKSKYKDIPLKIREKDLIFFLLIAISYLQRCNVFCKVLCTW